MKPLYKIWEQLTEYKKYTLFTNITEYDKQIIYDKIIDAMNHNQNNIYLYNYSNPFEIKDWLEYDNKIKCEIFKKEMINGKIKSPSDIYYCYISW